MKQLHLAQSNALCWRQASTYPTESVYKQFVVQKYGSIFKLIAKLMQLFAGKKYDFTKLNAMVTVFYQFSSEYKIIKKEVSQNLIFYLYTS